MTTVSQVTSTSSIPVQIVSVSIGKKFAMAITGAISFLWITGHMLGNLQIFIGQEQLNAYAHGLQSLGALLWILRVFMLTIILTHIWLSIQLKLENYSARPDRYAFTDTVKATLASRTMIYTGLIVLAFLIYHLLHLTVRVTNPEYATMTDSLGQPDVYSMTVLGFSNIYVSVFYLISVGLLCWHLSHGISSLFQSLGLTGKESLKRLERLGLVVSIVFFVGFASIPLGVLLGIIKPVGGN
jgi:succinate dehydrogenase / fumarate reductase cytochrome b subunit